MHPNVLFSDRDHSAGLDLVCDLLQNPGDQGCDLRSAQAFTANANHRGAVGATDGQESMEVRVEGDDDASPFERQVRDRLVSRAAVADVGDVEGINALIRAVSKRCSTVLRGRP